MKTLETNSPMHFDENNRFILGQDELVAAFSTAFSRTLERDAELFNASNQVQERTFMHRFAFELREYFRLIEEHRVNNRPVISLDVEYNRDGECSKQLDAIGKKWIAPDIILHERKSGALEGEEQYRNDIFVCEMKKSSKPGGEDEDKVKSFLISKKYQYGIDFYSFSEKKYRFTLFTLDGRWRLQRHEYCFDDTDALFKKENNPCLR